MLDARWVRENHEALRGALADRGSEWDVVAFLECDEERRRLIGQTESLQARRNEASKEIGALMKAGLEADAAKAKEEVRVVNEQLGVLAVHLERVEADAFAMLLAVPNPAHPSVPVGADESANVVVRAWGEPTAFDFDPKAHWDLGPELGVIDFERGVKLAKSRFVVLGHDGARLNRAIINLMLDTHLSRGYTEWALPILANADTLTGTGQLPKFEEDLFRTDGGLYLIPTAEVQLTNLHRDEVLDADALPLRYTAYTPCFREEAGAAGRDTRGMIRVHQFDKVELVKFARPEDSLDQLEGMVDDAEHVLRLLGLPHRTVLLCTGDMGFASRKTYDIEVWLPSYGGYKEISSCSDCGDFQARRASVKYRSPADFKGARYLHTLNGSGLAVGRTLAAVLENGQRPDGSVEIPEALRPYMGGQEIIRRR